MNTRIYSVEELNRMLPLIRAIVADIRKGYVTLRKELSSYGIQLGRAQEEPVDLRDLPWDLRDRIDEVQEWIAELLDLGLFLRDPEKGLVEAFGERDGEIVFYSWRAGEERVAYWHEVSGPPEIRRPLPAVTT